jgi:hypothetical protein
MKNNIILLTILLIPVLISLSPGIHAQGVRIKAGAFFKITGSAFIILQDGDFVNDGAFTSSSGGTLRMKGTAPQSIGGSATTSFGNLITDNAGGISFTNSETVNGTLTFNIGKLTLGANNLILGSSASISGSGSSKYVVTEGDGALRQRVMNNATDVTYPVGLATEYLPVTVRLTAGSMADDISVRVANGLYTAYDEGGVPAGSPLTGFAVQKTWYIAESIAGGTDATVKIQWNEVDEAPGFSRNWCDLGYYSGSTWVYSAGSQALGTNPYSQTLNGITSFSPSGVFSQHITCSTPETVFCASTVLPVDYTTTGIAPDPGNTFTAQLSDASGDFSSPEDIGTITSALSGTIYASIPATYGDGSAYRLRVISSNPPGTGDNNGTDLTIHHLRSISGNLIYYNQSNTPLTSDISVKLYQDGSQFGPEYEVNDGTYAFNDLCPGNYELRISSGMSTDGSVNTTDAAQVNYWGVHPYDIEKVRFYAGDVTGEPFYINSSDAQLIQANFVNGTPFNKGAGWTFWKTGEIIGSNSSPDQSYPTMTLPVGSNVSADIYGLCTGDFNRSFHPSMAKSASTSLKLVYTGNRQVGDNTEIELPLKMINPSGVGAVSLILNFPSTMTEITDVKMNEANSGLDWAVKGDELRIGWNSQDPVYPDAGSDLLTVKLKTTAAFTPGHSIRFTLAEDPLNELADESFTAIENAALGIDLIEASVTGFDEPSLSDGMVLGSYPNPFNDVTTLSYTLPFDGRATLEIRNIMGNRVVILLDDWLAAGNHTLKFDPAELDAGIYLVTLRLTNNSDIRVRTIKIIKACRKFT